MGKTEQQKLAQLLMAYRSTPTSATERTSAVLFQGREIRTRLDFLKTTAEPTITKHQRQRLFRWG